MAIRRWSPESFGNSEYLRKIEETVPDTKLHITAKESDELVENTMAIEIDIGGQVFSAICLQKDPEALIADSVDVRIVHDGSWSRRSDIPLDHVPAQLRYGPAGKEPTHIFPFYIKKDELNRLEETFKVK